MAETLGSLCDKLTIVKLKIFHADNEKKLASLEAQDNELQDEIDQYFADAISGNIPPQKICFDANKIYKKEGISVPDVLGSIGDVIGLLAEVNCKLWHEQEKVYEFESIAVLEKDSVVKNLAILNLHRNECIDSINKHLKQLVEPTPD